MPELVQRRDDDSYQLENTTELNSCTGDEFWSKHRDAVSYNQLQKFWSGLSVEERQELLKIDKQMLLEQARKSMYCSRCNGLLLEGFSQIIVYGKSSNHEVAHDLCMTSVCENDDVQDPSIHPWGGLTTTRDGLLTLSEIYLCSNSLKAIQNVFESARGRERERELLYPDACGGGGRGWISHGRGGHATRETCALHNATLSVDTLVDFWSALGDDTKLSLLTMKEEDFIQSLIYRFENKRFCRDCRRNVIREFKELKELKRIRKEPRCTKWFCGSDTAFQYEITDDTVQADWHDTFIDTFNTYQYFEWAIGSREEKFDIMELKNVGLSQKVQVSGLELNGLNSCYITLKAHKKNGHSSEFSVKAHALKGKECVHCKLVVGDGFVSMTRCENIKRFFEHAEEAEEEEDDESLDKDGNEMDSECLRPQKHAKSPELAREFLLDAAIVIFKEQVEKAFREGTARQNAHSMFVCLALKLLEDRVHVACKEIITYEKQMKLLEEEEKEKREEEERKERKRNKEREKKLRKKERLREKEKDKDVKGNEVNLHPVVINVSKEENSILDMDEDSLDHSDETPDMKDEDDLNLLNNLESSQELKNEKEFDRHRFNKHYNENFESLRNSNNGPYKQIRSYNANSKMRNNGPKFGEKFNSNSRSHHPCSCKNQQTEYRAKRESITYHGKSKSKNIITRKVWEPMEKKQNSDATLKTNNFEITETNQKVVTKSEEIEAVKTVGDEESELNYSSCLSEGSSNPQLESSFTSDSEDSSQNDTLEKKQSEQFTKQIVDSSGTVKTEANIDHERVKTGNVGQILLPPPLLHNQGLHFPMYQAPPPPNYGYIHHQNTSPVSWVGPNYGVTHPNHGYVLPGNFNYGYNGNVFMQYGLTPPPPPPVFNHHGGVGVGVLPVYNQTMIPPSPPPPPNQVVPGPLDEERVESKKIEKRENDGFSLFHFGGPIGGLNFDSVCLKEGIVVDDNKKNCIDCIEEYNLFGASKGMESCLLSFDI